MVEPDKTEPELCRIEVEEINQETGEATVYMEAADSDSYIMYYSYSLDGGNTYSMPDAWPRTDSWNQSDRSYRFTVNLPFDEPILLKTRASNGFDLWTESNVIELEGIPDPVRIEEESLKKSDAMKIIFLVTVIVLCMCFVSFFMSKMIFLLIKGNKRR